ncbi:hypothetical protein O181_065728 [Austropuccinia psidii MF-1]|uniref:Uncharacterized protein n=1 Tax=Austropuccinia psidii MF-1 TaxID=1389203 RepID=A0A9Q3I2W7_9BASI|nr:hypothetical protein [Austropuccinia psidii MF-1]
MDTSARLSRYPHPSTRPAAWATKWLSPEHPCSYHFQWGHWAMDCPRKSAGKPPIEDPKKKDPNFRYRKSEFVLHPALVSVEAEDRGKANIASIGPSTGDSNEASSSWNRDDQIIYPGWLLMFS